MSAWWSWTLAAIGITALLIAANRPRVGWRVAIGVQALWVAYAVAKGFVRPLRTAYWHTTCGTVTTMSRSIAETYATRPDFYGSTYCVRCAMHRPVGPDGEFYWCEPGDVERQAPASQPKVGT